MHEVDTDDDHTSETEDTEDSGAKNLRIMHHLKDELNQSLHKRFYGILHAESYRLNAF